MLPNNETATHTLSESLNYLGRLGLENFIDKVILLLQKQICRFEFKKKIKIVTFIRQNLKPNKNPNQNILKNPHNSEISEGYFNKLSEVGILDNTNNCAEIVHSF